MLASPEGKMYFGEGELSERFLGDLPRKILFEREGSTQGPSAPEKLYASESTSGQSQTAAILPYNSINKAAGIIYDRRRLKRIGGRDRHSYMEASATSRER